MKHDNKSVRWELLTTKAGTAFTCQHTNYYVYSLAFVIIFICILPVNIVFAESWNNQTIRYDAASLHHGGNWPRSMPKFQAYVHTGLYLGWIIDTNLYSKKFGQKHSTEIKKFKARLLTGPELYQHIGGEFTSDMLSDYGNEFTIHYYSMETGQFMDDYRNLLSYRDASAYDVVDTWENYFRISRYIQRQFDLWNESIN